MSVRPEDFPPGTPENYNLTRILDGRVPMEAVTRIVEHWQHAHPALVLDGKVGPSTLETIPLEPSPGEFVRPSGRSDVYRIFGDPADPNDPERPSAAWERANIVSCVGHPSGDLPPMPGVPANFWFRVHRTVEPLMRRAFQLASEYAPEYRIERAGCYVFRHQNHRPDSPLSYHSWGIAVDVDAAKNSVRHFPGGTAPEPWSEEWLDQWPRGLPEGFVRAFEEVGFFWGGRWKTRPDNMHFQYIDG